MDQDPFQTATAPIRAKQSPRESESHFAYIPGDLSPMVIQMVSYTLSLLPETKNNH